MLHRPLLTSIPTSTSTSRPPALQPAQPPSGSLPPHHHDHSHGLRSSSSAPVRPPAMKLQFINTAHPRDSTSAKRISQIRSHVAKDSHARRRQRRAANGSNRSSSACACACACSCSCVCPTASSTAAHAPAAAPTESPARSESPDSTSAGTSSINATSRLLTSSSSPAAGSCATTSSTTSAEDEDCPGFRKIAPKTRAVVRTADLPHPRKLIGDTKTDGWSFAWELSPDECKTFDFCKFGSFLLLTLHVTSLPLSPYADPRSDLKVPILQICRGACGAHEMLPDLPFPTPTPLVTLLHTVRGISLGISGSISKELAAATRTLSYTVPHQKQRRND